MLIVVSIVLGVFSGYLYIQTRLKSIGETTITPPSVLAEYSLVDFVSGEEAVSMISRIHMFSENVGRVVDGVVAMYTSSRGTAHLWISIVPSEEEAKRLTELMRDEISKGDTPYSPPKLMRIDKTDVYWGIRSNMYYYFFYKKNMVIWVSITGDEDSRSNFLKELLKRV